MNLFRGLTLRIKRLFELKSPKPEVQVSEVSPTINAPDDFSRSKGNRKKPAQTPKMRMNNPVSKKCPHGITREYCFTCDRKGHEFHVGDWRSD